MSTHSLNSEKKTEKPSQPRQGLAMSWVYAEEINNPPLCNILRARTWLCSCSSEQIQLWPKPTHCRTYQHHPNHHHRLPLLLETGTGPQGPAAAGRDEPSSTESGCSICSAANVGSANIQTTNNKGMLFIPE